MPLSAPVAFAIALAAFANVSPPRRLATGKSFHFHPVIAAMTRRVCCFGVGYSESGFLSVESCHENKDFTPTTFSVPNDSDCDLGEK